MYFHFKIVGYFILAGCFMACIPLRTAPTIKNYEVQRAKKFKKDLPERYAFIFEDNNPEGYFYNFMDRRFERQGVNVNRFVPIEIDSTTYYMSFYEVKRVQKTVNVLGMIVNDALDPDGDDDNDISKADYWYIALTVADRMDQDCLDLRYTHQEAIVSFLRQLQLDYLKTYKN